MRPNDDKDALRRRVTERRMATTAAVREREDRLRNDVLRTAVESLRPGILACYCSVPPEPATAEFINSCQADGWRVLLPVLSQTPDWAWFDNWDATKPSWRGIKEPLGPRLGASVLREAALVVVPALAVDHRGNRLGTGGGWYDRALDHLSPTAQVWALVNDDELLDVVPSEPHDMRVSTAVCPSGIVPLDRDALAER